jgi:hypothetical protein
MSDMVAGDSDTRKTVRFTPEQVEWLEAAAERTGARGVGTVVCALVQAEINREKLVRGAAARREETSTPAGRVAGARAADHAALVAEDEARAASGVVGSLPGGAGASSPSAPAPDLHAGPMRRLDVAVARLKIPDGPLPPAATAAARRLIKDGRVRVSGRAAGDPAIVPGLLVGPGEVEIVDA